MLDIAREGDVERHHRKGEVGCHGVERGAKRAFGELAGHEEHMTRRAGRGSCRGAQRRSPL